MRISDKIESIEGFLQELQEIVPLGFDEYKRDNKTKADCERYFEKIREAVVDLVFLVIREKDFKSLENEDESFRILVYNNVIDRNLGRNLRSAKGMRNFIVYQYDKIDNKMVFETVSEKLGRDVKEFIKAVKLMI